MKNERYTLLKDLDDDEAALAGCLYHAYVDALPVLAMVDAGYALLQLAMHVPSEEWFVLLAVPDGPFLALSPMTEAAEVVLRAGVPQATPMRVSGAADWANCQRWRPVMRMDLRRNEDDEWEPWAPAGDGGGV